MSAQLHTCEQCGFKVDMPSDLKLIGGLWSCDACARKQFVPGKSRAVKCTSCKRIFDDRGTGNIICEPCFKKL